MSGIKTTTHGVNADEKTTTKQGNQIQVKNATSGVTGGEILYLDSNGDFQQLDAGNSGEVLQSGGEGEAPSWGSAGSILAGDSASINTTGGVAQTMSAVGSGIQQTYSFRAARAGTISDFYVQVNTNSTNAGTTIGISINGTPSAVVCSTASPGQTGNLADTTHSASVSAGDELEVVITPASGIGSISGLSWSFLI